LFLKYSSLSLFYFLINVIKKFSKFNKEKIIKFDKKINFNLIENKHLCFDNFVKYELINTKNYEIKTQFTIPQKEAIMKMMIGLLAERPILLTGEIGTGKTFIFEQLANIIGAKLSAIHFNSETTSLDIMEG
jgi:midasin (ATPase involved in ribosome maturation)